MSDQGEAVLAVLEGLVQLAREHCVRQLLTSRCPVHRQMSDHMADSQVAPGLGGARFDSWRYALRVEGLGMMCFSGEAGDAHGG